MIWTIAANTNKALDRSNYMHATAKNKCFNNNLCNDELNVKDSGPMYKLMIYR